MDFSTFLGSVSRTIGAIISGVLISRGLPIEVVAAISDPATQVITGVVSALGIQVWSLFEKKK